VVGLGVAATVEVAGAAHAHTINTPANMVPWNLVRLLI
jgi:hypothetical protein